jgi:membrane AbrB-like protein
VKITKPKLIALAVAAVGVEAFLMLGLPLPLLLGPIFACLVAALLRVPLTGFPKIADAMRTVIGLAVGSSFTPELLDRIGGMMGSLSLIPVFVLAIGLVGVPYFRRVCGYDTPTSFYSAMPGGLQDMLVFGQEAGGNVRSMSLIHATRVLVLVSALPFVLQGVWDLDMSTAPGVSAQHTPLEQIAILLLCAIVGWWGALKVRLFGASILGPLILAATLSMAGILTTRPPAEAIMISQFFLGLGVGVKYVGITGKELRHDVLAAIGFCIILGALGAGFAYGITAAGIAHPVESILAFSPGGQAEMTVLAIVAGADVAFVVSHHVIRVFLVILCAPLFSRLFR